MPGCRPVTWADTEWLVKSAALNVAVGVDCLPVTPGPSYSKWYSTVFPSGLMLPLSIASVWVSPLAEVVASVGVPVDHDFVFGVVGVAVWGVFIIEEGRAFELVRPRVLKVHLPSQPVSARWRSQARRTQVGAVPVHATVAWRSRRGRRTDFAAGGDLDLERGRARAGVAQHGQLGSTQFWLTSSCSLRSGRGSERGHNRDGGSEHGRYG